MKPVAVIMARGGSKRLPGKHLLEVGGVPVIGHAVRYALASTSDVYVSTDCPNIAAVSESHGATVIHRPARLAMDDSPVAAAILHASEQLHGAAWDCMVTLEGATIILRREIIEESIRLLEASKADGSTTITRAAEKHPDWALSLDDNSFVRPLAAMAANSQQLRPLWHYQGSVEVTRRSALERADRSIRHLSMCGEFLGVEVTDSDRIHIDDIDDLNYARWLLAVRYGIIGYPK